MSQVPYAVVKLARDKRRPTGLDYIQNIFTDFLELHGDRRYGDDPAIVGGIAYLGELPVSVIDTSTLGFFFFDTHFILRAKIREVCTHTY